MAKLTLALVLVGILGANQPPSAAEVSSNALTDVLARWQKAWAAAPVLNYRVTYSKTDHALDEKARICGYAEVWLERPGRLRLELRDSHNQLGMLFLCGHGELREYDYKNRRLVVNSLPRATVLPDAVFQWVSKLPPERQGGYFAKAVSGVLAALAWRIFGPPLDGLQGRYDVRLMKQDEWETHLRLVPKYQAATLEVVLRSDGTLQSYRELAADTEQSAQFRSRPRARFPRQTWEPPFEQLPLGWERVDSNAAASAYTH